MEDAMMLDIPEDGDLLSEGNYLIEMELGRPISSEVFKKAVERMGFQEAILDEEPKIFEPSTEAPAQVRFIAALDKPIEIQNTPYVRWFTVHRITFDPFANMNLSLTLFPLQTKTTYELRLLARMKSEPTRAEVLRELTKMGWAPLRLSLLKKDMRLPGKPNASVTMWYALATWEKACSYITDQEPFFFEDVVALTSLTAPTPDESDVAKVVSPHPQPNFEGWTEEEVMKETAPWPSEPDSNVVISKEG
jgi:hypothetical protein